MERSDQPSDDFSRRYEPDVLGGVTAELARGTTAVAWIGNMPLPERSGLLEGLANYLTGENIRVIVVDDVDREPIGVRRFCELLAAAAPWDGRARDAAEHLAMTFTSARPGERGLALIVENADTLSTETLAFAERLATASGAQALPVQILLVGSHILESRLPEAGSFVVKKLAHVAAAPARSTLGRGRGKWTGRGLAAAGCLAALILFLAAASGDREREQVSAETTAAVAAVLPARAAELGAFYAGLPTRAIGMTKRLFDNADTATLDEQLELEAQLQAVATQTDDFREGVTAFLEKRPPTFTGT